jgi:hypothetical protein
LDREALEDGTVKAAHDARTDTLSIILNADAAVAESHEDKSGAILDYDGQQPGVTGDPRRSKRVAQVRRIEFETTG